MWQLIRKFAVNINVKDEPGYVLGGKQVKINQNDS
jgi:hypothetical protein